MALYFHPGSVDATERTGPESRRESPQAPTFSRRAVGRAMLPLGLLLLIPFFESCMLLKTPPITWAMNLATCSLCLRCLMLLLAWLLLGLLCVVISNDLSARADFFENCMILQTPPITWMMNLATCSLCLRCLMLLPVLLLLGLH